MSLWQIHLLGGLRLERGSEVVTRFRSQKFGMLLAYLALFPRRVHSREELADLLWPDADVEAGRTNLRTALASLRRQLEGPNAAPNSVLCAQGHTHVSLNPEGFRTDVNAFEAALAAATQTADQKQKAAHLLVAVGQYNGHLLPGCYESWALSERDRLADAHRHALRELADLHEAEGDFDHSLDFARRAVSADPTQEDAHAHVIRLLMATDQTGAAQRQFDELARILKEQWDGEPSPAVRALLRGVPAPTKRPAPHPTPVPKAVTENTTPAPAPTTNPAPVAETAPASTLPLHPTRFFGREDEIAALSEWLRTGSRLITITGPGGSGKTRVAVQTARQLSEAFAGGVYFVPLTEVTDAERMPDAFADAIGLTRSSANKVPMRQQVETALQAKNGPVLLVLDNFEQLAEAGALYVAELMERAPLVSCLVTSRQRLRIAWEREFPLLPLPTPAHPGTPIRLLEFASVQLFVSRAQTARTDFQLTARNAAAVAALCDKLEGIPLAIELAAAWAEMLTPAQMLQKMEQRFSLLVSRRRDVPLRHRTLRAVLESSLSLLDPEIGRFFSHLSVFRRGWTLEAAEAVTGEPLAAAYLATLRDHSLLVAEPQSEDEDAPLRFRMLEIVREYARELAAEADDSVSDLEARHAAYFTKFAEDAVPHLTGASQTSYLRWLDADHDNLRAALSWYEQTGHIADALHLAGMLSGFWHTRGYVLFAREQLARLLSDRKNVPTLVQAQALSGLGKLAYFQGDYATAHSTQNEALALFQAENDADGIAKSLNELGNCEMLHSNYPGAAEFYGQSLAAYRKLNDAKGIALLLNNTGAISLAQGHPTVAKPYLQESLPISRAAGHFRVVAITLLNLAVIAQYEREWDLAKTYLEESLAVRRDLGDEAGAGRTLECLAHLAMEEGDPDTALLRFEEAFSLLRKTGERERIASTLHYRGIAYAKQKGDLASGAVDLVDCLVLSRELGNKHFTMFSLNALGSVALACNEPEWAARLFAIADVQIRSLGLVLKPNDEAEWQQERGTARRLLGQDVYEAAQTAGRNLSLDEATALGLKVLPLSKAFVESAAVATPELVGARR